MSPEGGMGACTPVSTGKFFQVTVTAVLQRIAHGAVKRSDDATVTTAVLCQL